MKYLTVIISVMVCVVAAFIAASQTDLFEWTNLNNDKVVERSDGLTARPKWANVKKSFTIEKDDVFLLGAYEMPEAANKRLSNGYRIAENNAKTGLAAEIQRRLVSVFQKEEDKEIIEGQAYLIGKETSKLVASSLHPTDQYYEKVFRETNSDGERDLIYRIFVRVSMSESDFKEAVHEAIRRNSGKNGITEDFATKVEERWDQIKK